MCSSPALPCPANDTAYLLLREHSRRAIAYHVHHANLTADSRWCAIGYFVALRLTPSPLHEGSEDRTVE